MTQETDQKGSMFLMKDTEAVQRIFLRHDTDSPLEMRPTMLDQTNTVSTNKKTVQSIGKA